MGASEQPRSPRRWIKHRRAGLLVAAVLLAGLLAFALSRLGLHRIGHALVTASPGWVALAFVLMAGSLVLRSISWHQVLRAALPETPIPWAAVTRATMIGVMGSAVVPGRIGEPARVVVITRRLEGSSRRQIPIVAGTVFSQTLINLLALAILAGVTFTSVPLLSGHPAGIATAIAIPLLICALVVAGPRLLALGRRSGSARIARWADTLAGVFALARRGLIVFARPRYGSTAIGAQLLAWALQWLACYSVLLALGLQHKAGLAAAAAILLAINVSAILPATPSNVGVFQAACLVVLTAYGVGGGPGLAYGIILQAVEVLTALALGVPALLGEGLTWRDIRAESASESKRARAEQGLATEQGTSAATPAADPDSPYAGPDGAEPDEVSAGDRSAGDRAQ
ncbi:MAG TPA: lysylphosphatidylglycerol synthase transmembrane domain-containing protein [Solirubrobacteraceae bacterium]|jgi:phosphatidylinositol alpha-mannosyltransferase|nr:lysylphosphatidylglycerol synthase transmembrane domain-containing protein [Solirubrobacteraceae bacterium]